MDKELIWRGPILDISGYASAARGYLKACESVDGINIKAYDRSRSMNLKGKGMDQSILDMYERLKRTKVLPDCPAVQHQVPDAFFKDKKTKKSIGYTIFEMTQIPQTWVDPCNSMNVIWTGSKYSQKAFQRSGVKVPVEILPHAIDLETYKPEGLKWNIENRRTFAFLSVFDFTSRKSWKDLLKAYWTAFGPKDDVCLILKCYFGDFSENGRKDIIRRIAQYRHDLGKSSTAPILLYGHDIDSCDMPSLYRSADCYVGISREGFGLPFAESMACGLPCIGPEASGTRQFMSPENSFLVKYLHDETIDDEITNMFPSFKGLQWAVHDWEHLSSLMKIAVDDPNGLKKIANLGLETIRKDLSYEVIGNKIKELLD